MDSDTIILDITEKMDKTIENLEKRFTTVRAGRANPSSLDGVSAEYYGVLTPLKQLATISVPEARQLLIKPFDKHSLGAIEKAILASNLGYNPSNDGETINKISDISSEAVNKISSKLNVSNDVSLNKIGEKITDVSNDTFNKINEKINEASDDSLSRVAYWLFLIFMGLFILFIIFVIFVSTF